MVGPTLQFEPVLRTSRTPSEYAFNSGDLLEAHHCIHNFVDRLTSNSEDLQNSFGHHGPSIASDARLATALEIGILFVYPDPAELLRSRLVLHFK
eukprot:m.220852 g.220852  ORF g.220852 m.220852 type:complete len:95 (+) comp25793_c0_seq4:1107-1391(+)